MPRLLSVLRPGRLLAALALVFLAVPLWAGTAAAAPASEGPVSGPALWEIERGDSHVYLFGTIHLLPPETRWRTPLLDKAIAAADSAWEEIAPADAQSPALQELVRQYGFYEAGKSLSGEIGPELTADIGKLAQDMGLQPSALEPLRPWLVTVTLTIAYAQSHGFQSDSGVEKALTEAFAARRVPVMGLESISDSILAMATMSPAAERLMLEDMKRQLSDMNAILDRMHSAWLHGDMQDLETLVLSDLQRLEEVYQALIVKRNQAWLPKIETLAKTPGTHLVAVGAAHMLGDDGLIALLRAKGYRVKRLDNRFAAPSPN